MKYTDSDMKMMALGEIGADVMSVVAAVLVWVCLGDVLWLLKIPAAIVTQILVSKASLGFVHMGYRPEDQ